MTQFASTNRHAHAADRTDAIIDNSIMSDFKCTTSNTLQLVAAMCRRCQSHSGATDLLTSQTSDSDGQLNINISSRQPIILTLLTFRCLSETFFL